MLKDYIYGILITDGNLNLTYYKNGNIRRGRVTLSISPKDADIAYKLADCIPNSHIKHRKKEIISINSHSYKNYETIEFINNYKWFRDELINRGFPIKDKTYTCSIPNDYYDESDFWRGVIDGDGSIGYTSTGEPFLSLTTCSDRLSNSYKQFLFENFGIEKILKKNKRDGCYNIVLKNEDAINVATFLYECAEIYIDRKYNKYLEIKNWVRTKKKICRKCWNKFEDDYIMTHTIEESVNELKRSERSVKCRLFRIKHKNE